MEQIKYGKRSSLLQFYERWENSTELIYRNGIVQIQKYNMLNMKVMTSEDKNYHFVEFILMLKVKDIT